jgi:hypothetical protein
MDPTAVLARARRHLADGEAGIAWQVALLQRLRAAGYPTSEDEWLLAAMAHTLSTMRKRVAQMEAQLDGTGKAVREARSAG